jgi:hypothetical protein
MKLKLVPWTVWLPPLGDIQMLLWLFKKYNLIAKQINNKHLINIICFPMTWITRVFRLRSGVIHLFRDCIIGSMTQWRAQYSRRKNSTCTALIWQTSIKNYLLQRTMWKECSCDCLQKTITVTVEILQTSVSSTLFFHEGTPKIIFHIPKNSYLRKRL